MTTMENIHKAFWDRIQAFEIDDPDSQFKFSDRLARENMWTKEYTLRVIEEYRAFMFLGTVIKSHAVTPSVPIDQCWHLHMIYSRNYEAFCEVLGKKFHHGPTKGGKQQEDKFEEQYRLTFNARAQYFRDTMYPYDIWCLPADRWKPVDLRYVDMTKHWVVPTGDVKALFNLLIQEIKTKLKCFFGSLAESLS
jgi:hypothetical protein